MQSVPLQFFYARILIISHSWKLSLGKNFAHLYMYVWRPLPNIGKYSVKGVNKYLSVMKNYGS